MAAFCGGKGRLSMSFKKQYELKDGPDKPKDGSGSPEKPEKKGKADEQPVFKTEESLKQEARERLEEEERRRAEAPPQSERRKKYDNFMYHYRTHTVVAIIGAILVIFFLRDTFFKAKPDMTLIIASARYIPQYEADAIRDTLEKYAWDLNGDGKVIVGLDTIHLPTAAAFANIHDDEKAEAGAGGEGAVTGEGGEEAGQEDFSAIMSGADPEMEQASSMKLMAIISAWSDPLFLLDDALYNYLVAMSGPSALDEAEGETEGPYVPDAENWMFDPITGPEAAFGYFGDRLAIKDTLIIDEPDCEYLGELAFSLRPAPNSKQKSIEYQQYCLELLKTIAKQ